MLRRNLNITVGVLLLLAVPGCAKKKEEKAAPKEKEGTLTHVVIFQLKKDAPASATETLIADAHELLEKIPTVRGLRTGRPFDKSEDIALVTS